MQAPVKRRDPKPDILRIEEVVRQVKTGDIKLPKFQRPFVWKRSDILSLLDSIYKGYPIGSILLWFTNEKLASEKSIADLSINERDEEYPTNYILDGQQRVSALCGALYYNGSDPKSQWNIYFDLERERFFHGSTDSKPEFFPLNKLLDTFEFLDQINTFSLNPKREKYKDVAGKLLNSIKDYKLAAVTLRDMNLNEVAPIFERINSTGRKLTIVDLMRAATWKEGFDLNDAVRSVKEACRDKNFDGISELHVLRSISAAIGNSFNREDIEKLRDSTPERLKIVAGEIIPAYQLSVDFLTRELPLSSIAYLPYALQLNFLVEFFRICPKPSFIQRNELKRWFWSTSFARYFASLNTNVINKDIEEFREFAMGKRTSLSDNYYIRYDDFLSEPFALNKATSQSFALLLAQMHPRSLLDGSAINIHRALNQVNRHEFHHLFPKAYLKAMGINDAMANQHANICLLSSYNNKVISDSKPSDYFTYVSAQLGNQTHEVLYTNYIDEKALDGAMIDDFAVFLEHRKLMLIAEMQKLTKYAGAPAN